MDNATCFASFGSGQLIGFNVIPMKVILVAEDEGKLRERLREAPFDNEYCTTYPIGKASTFINEWDCEAYTLDELLSLQR